MSTEGTEIKETELVDAAVIVPDTTLKIAAEHSGEDAPLVAKSELDTSKVEAPGTGDGEGKIPAEEPAANTTPLLQLDFSKFSSFATLYK